MADVVTFKKYANRRIYNTHRSRYITMYQPGEVIRQVRKSKPSMPKPRRM